MGGLNDTTVVVPISAIRIANAKMTELVYEKKINAELRSIITNDSIIIDAYKNRLIAEDKKHIKELNSIRNQRNTAYIVSGVFLLTTILSILK